MEFLLTIPMPEVPIATVIGFALGFLAGGRWGGSSRDRSLT